MFRYALLTLSLAAAPGFAQTVSFEGTSFPETQGDWVRVEVGYPADRWIENGWFVQSSEIAATEPPFFGEQGYYEHSLAALTGTDTYFEWVMVTDGPEAWGAIAPTAFVAYNESGVVYRFTIGDDRLVFSRGGTLNPFVFVDFEPGPHLFRLELRGTDLYTFIMDGVEIDSGVPDGPFPTPDAAIVFGATAAIRASITRWDYVRFGPIPIDASGDFDSDGDLDSEDFYFFHECLSNNTPDTNAGPGCRFADMNEDGNVDFRDFALFQRSFTGTD